MKSTLCAAVLAAVALLVLAACGQGEDTPITAPPSGPSSAEIKAVMNAIVDRSNTLIEEEDRKSLFGPQRSVMTASPGYDVRNVLVARLTGQLFAPIGGYTGYPDYDIFGEEAEYEFLASEGGISAAAAAWDRADPRGRWTYAYLSFGAWMQHNLFLAKQTLVFDPVHDETIVYLDIFSIGAASGTNPTPAGGSATWSGIMMGYDEGFSGTPISRFETAEPNMYVGEAELTLEDFAAPTVDVRFSNITNEVRVLRDVLWTDLPVTEGGFEGRGILGRFYGPQHEEVGGVFQFDQINGAFGAVRGE